MHTNGRTTPMANLEVLAQAAITAALTNNWPEAVKINKKIVTHQNNDVEALLRLARAMTCLGQTPKAQRIYKKVLAIDPYNLIAIKNLEKLAKTKRSFASQNGNGANHNGNGKTVISADLNITQVFLYEPGKTKTVNLLNLASPQVLATLSCGDPVNLNPKNHAITITSLDDTYLGAFPDDLAHRLIALIAAGNKYHAYIKSTTTKILTVFIKETERSSKFANQPSFQSKNGSFFEEE